MSISQMSIFTGSYITDSQPMENMTQIIQDLPVGEHKEMRFPVLIKLNGKRRGNINDSGVAKFVSLIRDLLWAGLVNEKVSREVVIDIRNDIREIFVFPGEMKVPEWYISCKMFTEARMLAVCHAVAEFIFSNEVISVDQSSVRNLLLHESIMENSLRIEVFGLEKNLELGLSLAEWCTLNSDIYEIRLLDEETSERISACEIIKYVDPYVFRYVYNKALAMTCYQGVDREPIKTAILVSEFESNEPQALDLVVKADPNSKISITANNTKAQIYVTSITEEGIKNESFDINLSNTSLNATGFFTIDYTRTLPLYWLRSIKSSHHIVSSPRAPTYLKQASIIAGTCEITDALLCVRDASENIAIRHLCYDYLVLKGIRPKIRPPPIRTSYPEVESLFIALDTYNKDISSNFEAAFSSEHVCICLLLVSLCVRYTGSFFIPGERIRAMFPEAGNNMSSCSLVLARIIFSLIVRCGKNVDFDLVDALVVLFRSDFCPQEFDRATKSVENILRGGVIILRKREIALTLTHTAYALPLDEPMRALACEILEYSQSLGLRSVESRLSVIGREVDDPTVRFELDYAGDEIFSMLVSASRL